MNKLLLLLISGMENISDASFADAQIVTIETARNWEVVVQLATTITSYTTGQYSQSHCHLINFRGVKLVHTPAVWKC
jgi:hypothetical protein